MVTKFLWLIVIILLMLSFSIQVSLLSPLPSIFPYIGISFIILFRLSNKNKDSKCIKNKNISILISIYTMLVLFQAILQSAFAYISIAAAITSIFVFIFPIIFYYYLSRFAKEQEFHIILVAISICGIISGLYFVYDSYSMLVLGKVSEFSIKMLNYSQIRAPDLEQNVARITAFSRSHGLLEKHSISSAWIAIGCFSMLALFPKRKTFLRICIILIFGVMIFISLNFTSIIAFVFIIFFIEFKGYLILKGRILKNNLKMLSFIMIPLISAILITQLYGIKLFSIINEILLAQGDLAVGKTNYAEGSYFGSLIKGFIDFPANNLKSFPLGLIVGDGFTSWGVIPKGGDFGIIETLQRFGLPFFLATIIGLLRLIKISLKKIELLKHKDDIKSRYLTFAVCVISYLLFCEIHYSVWYAKSVLPLLFICLSIFSRFLNNNQENFSAFAQGLRREIY